jgi:LmbE family N-acetylglucosaminyl deacetylase
MLKKVTLILAAFLFYATAMLFAASVDTSLEIGTLDAIQKEDRVLILVPHPDDETIACAGVIQEALKAGAEVKVVYLTNGDHNQLAFIVYEKRIPFRKGEFIHMGEVRRQEAIRAMKLLGLGADNLIFLGYPDFGTFTIFSRCWQNEKPYKGLLTRISAVPYKENLSFGAPYKGESVLKDLESVLSGYKPNKIFVSHPADVNVDHKTLYLFLQIALLDLKSSLPSPQVYPYLVHCVGWPTPRHYHPELELGPPRQFQGDREIKWLKRELTPAQLAKKYQAILCYRSQTQSSAFYLFSFARKNELFGEYPLISLERQISLKEKGISFFGFSELYNDSEMDILDPGSLIEDAGVVSYAVVDDLFLIRVEKKEELSRRFSAIFYLFGYSDKVHFAQMPKLRIVTRYSKFRIFNGRKMIKPQGISLEVNSNTLILKIPLELLGNPDFILSAIKSHAGILPISATGFRKIEIR